MNKLVSRSTLRKNRNISLIIEIKERVYDYSSQIGNNSSDANYIRFPRRVLT